jgi:hypothetical protein
MMPRECAKLAASQTCRNARRRRGRGQRDSTSGSLSRRGERRPLHLLHHQIGEARLGDAHAVEGDDARMLELCGDPRFLPERDPVLWAREVRIHDFDGDASLEIRIPRFVDRAHASRTEDANQLEHADPSPDLGDAPPSSVYHAVRAALDRHRQRLRLVVGALVGRVGSVFVHERTARERRLRPPRSLIVSELRSRDDRRTPDRASPGR